MAIFDFIMDMRIRYPELLKDRPGLTSYRIVADSNGRVKPATIYRLKKNRGWMPTFDNDLIEVLLDAFKCSYEELWERGGAPPRPRATKKRRD